MEIIRYPRSRANHLGTFIVLSFFSIERGIFLADNDNEFLSHRGFSFLGSLFSCWSPRIANTAITMKKIAIHSCPLVHAKAQIAAPIVDAKKLGQFGTFIRHLVLVQGRHLFL